MKTTYGFGQEFHIIEELYYIFAFFKITYFGYQASQKGRLLQLFLTMSLLSTTQIWIMLLLPTVLCSRFERLANKLKTQVEHQVITKHKKEINRATIHHFNKKNFHHAYYTYGKARKTFLVFSKFCKFLFDFRFCKFYFLCIRLKAVKVQVTSLGGSPPRWLQAYCCWLGLYPIQRQQAHHSSCCYWCIYSMAWSLSLVYLSQVWVESIC